MLQTWAESVSSFFTPKTLNILESLLSSTDRKLASLLDNDIHKLHKDAAGLDPFYCRVRQKTPRINLSVRELLAQFNLCGDNTNSFNWRELESNEKTDIPAVVHFIWAGSALVDADGRRKEMKHRIQTWRKHNPTIPIIIWTDQASKKTADHLNPAMTNMKLWCSNNNIALINIDDIFAGNMEFEEHYLLESQLRNFGATADILRLNTLLRFGGTYADIDITCRAPLNLKSKTGFRINSGKCYSDELSPLSRLSTLMNDVIQSVPNHPILQELLSDMAIKYTQTFAEMYEKTGIILVSGLGKPPISYGIALGLQPESTHFLGVTFKIEPHLKITAQQLRRESTISRSGPGVYVRVLQKKQLNMDYEYIPDQDFDFQSISSWLEYFSDCENYNEPERIQIIKYILNGILHDLQDEPHFLRFDQYAKSINKYQIANILLYLLAKHFPEKLHNVRYVSFYEACDNVNALKFFCDNKEYLPNVKLDTKTIIDSFLQTPKLFALKWLKENLHYDFNTITTSLPKPFLTLLCHVGNFTSFEQFKIIVTESIRLGATVNPDPVKGVSPLGVICRAPNKPNFLDWFDLLLQHSNQDGVNNFQENPLCNLLKNRLNETSIIAVNKLLQHRDIDVSTSGRNSDNDEIGTPLHYAVRNFDIPAIQLLLKHHPQDIRLPFSYNHSQFQIANITVMELIAKLHEENLKEMQEDSSPKVFEKQEKIDLIHAMLQKDIRPLIEAKSPTL